MKKYLPVLLALGACLALNFAYGQNNISGQVVDTNKISVPGALVSLLSNDKLIKSAATDTGGHFSLTGIPQGSYTLRVTAIGFKPYQSAVAANGQPIVVRLQATATTLKEVAITAQKSLIEEKIDRTVMNVSALISATGSNALEVLEKAPGVTVDENGNITFNGKSGVLVLIDDRPTYLSAANLATYLKGMPASSLDKIELMENPPARYDAAGNAGAINIKTKRLKSPGFNGSFSSSYRQSVYGKTLESLNLNYHEGKVNLFANTSYGYQRSYRRLDLDRLSATGSFTQTAFYAPVSQNPSIVLGADYYPSANTIIGIALSGSLSPGHDHNPVSSILANQQGAVDSTVTADNSTQSTFNRTGVNLNYSHQYKQQGRSLTFDLDNINFDANKEQTFINSIYLPNNILKSNQTVTDNLPVTIHIYAAKTDYSQPLPGKARLDAGLKISFVNTDNAANYFNVINNITTVDNTNTNRFLYKENINAAYLNYSQEFKRWSLQAGLRLENTNGNGKQLGNTVRGDSSFVHHYTDLFPTFYLSYKLDAVGKNSLTLSYGRRIGRPYYQDLNPFIFMLDKFTYFSGNPFLRPQFSSNYSLAYHLGSRLTLTAAYNHATDIQNETIQQQGNIFVSRTGNIGEYNYYGLTARLHLDPANWWLLNVNMELSHNHYQGALYSATIDETSGYFLANAYNQFTLSKTWSAEMSGIYSAPHANAQFTRIGTGHLDAAIQKKIWNNQASLKLTMNDIFNTNSPSGTITNIPGTTATYHNINDSRAVTFGFTYNFGTNTTKQKRKTGSADNETERVKN